MAVPLSVVPSASGGQCGFMTIGYTSPSQSLENSEGTGGAEAERHGTRGRDLGLYCWGPHAFEQGIKRYQLFIKRSPFYC